MSNSDLDWEDLIIVFVIVLILAAGALEIIAIINVVKFFLGLYTGTTGWLIFCFVWVALLILGAMGTRVTVSK